MKFEAAHGGTLLALSESWRTECQTNDVDLAHGDAMTKTQLPLISLALTSNCWRLARWTAIDVVLGAGGGAVFGAVFGTLWFLAYRDPAQIFSIAGYFGLCGVVAGTLLGIAGGLCDVQENSEPAPLPPLPARHSAVPREVVRAPVTQEQPRPRHRFAGLLKENRIASEILTSQDPNRN